MGIGDLNDKGPEFPVPFLKGGKGMDRKYMEIPVVKQIAEAEEVGWVNPKSVSYTHLTLPTIA